jgi:aspartate 1-decarboxylase
MRKILRGKIHRAVVTAVELDYEGSLSIDADLMERAAILPHEAVEVWNLNNGERFETYAIAAPRGSGVVCVNGAAAHKAAVGHRLIIATFDWMPDAEATRWTPKIVRVDDLNRST